MPMVVYTEEEMIEKCDEAQANGARRCAEDRDRAKLQVVELRNALRRIADDDPSGKWGRWAREALER